MEKGEIIKEVLKYIDVEGIVSDLLIEKVIYAKVDELVQSSENTLDDGLAAILKPQLKKAVVDYIAAEKAKLMA